MSSTFHTPIGFLRIILTIFAVMIMAGCVDEEKASQAVGGNVNISGDDTNTDSDSDGPGPQIGSFSLSWAAPVTRSDGSPMSLAEIDGYKVYYGSTQGDYPKSVDINDGTETAMTVSGVPVGDYYIVMTTYDSDGRESTQSSVVNKQAL